MLPRSKKVLVLGSDTRSFLSVVRSLGRGGLIVDSAWTAPSSLARRSRYLRHVHDDLPPYLPGDRRWLDSLRTRVSEMKYDLVIPTCDPAILPLQFHREELDARHYYLLDNKAFEICSDKRKTYGLAVAQGVPVPDQVIVRSVAEGHEAAKRFGYPVILKPFSSFTLEGGNNKQFVQRAANARSLDQLLPPMLHSGGVCVQPYFEGVGIGVEVLAREGQILACFQHQRIHEPLLGGGSSYRKSIPPHPELVEATGRLMRAMNYTGAGMVEFRLNLKTAGFILVEVNGRFWGSLPLAVAAGADFPLWLYQMWVEGRDHFPAKARVGLYCRNLLLDWDWFADQVGAKRPEHAAAPISMAQLAGEFWNVITLRERCDTFVLDDQAPGFAELRKLAARCAKSLPKFILSSKSLYGLRSFLRWRHLRRLRFAKKLVFLCKGNICRSPFAAAYAHGVLPGLDIHSAGYYPAANRPSPEIAIAEAASFGVDLSQKRSSMADEGLLRQADAIIVFDYEDYLTVRNTYHVPASKTVLLGLLDRESALIGDPYGGSREKFRATYSRIVRALDHLARWRRNSGQTRQPRKPLPSPPGGVA